MQNGSIKEKVNKKVVQVEVLLDAFHPNCGESLRSFSVKGFLDALHLKLWRRHPLVSVGVRVMAKASVGFCWG